MPGFWVEVLISAAINRGAAYFLRKMGGGDIISVLVALIAFCSFPALFHDGGKNAAEEVIWDTLTTTIRVPFALMFFVIYALVRWSFSGKEKKSAVA